MPGVHISSRIPGLLVQPARQIMAICTLTRATLALGFQGGSQPGADLGTGGPAPDAGEASGLPWCEPPGETCVTPRVPQGELQLPRAPTPHARPQRNLTQGHLHMPTASQASLHALRLRRRQAVAPPGVRVSIRVAAHMDQ